MTKRGGGGVGPDHRLRRDRKLAGPLDHDYWPRDELLCRGWGHERQKSAGGERAGDRDSHLGWGTSWHGRQRAYSATTGTHNVVSSGTSGTTFQILRQYSVIERS